MEAPEEGAEREEATTRTSEYRLTKSPDYKMIYTNGVFGSLNRLEGRITFYADRIMPKLIDGEGGMSTDYVERELLIEVKMSPTEYVSISKWMEGWIEKLVESGDINIIGEPEADEN